MKIIIISITVCLFNFQLLAEPKPVKFRKIAIGKSEERNITSDYRVKEVKKYIKQSAYDELLFNLNQTRTQLIDQGFEILETIINADCTLKESSSALGSIWYHDVGSVCSGEILYQPSTNQILTPRGQ